MTKELRNHLPNAYVIDIKAQYRGLKYLRETLKFVQELGHPILIQQIKNHLAGIGAIHTA
ncbi:MAG: hypothetical protein D6675_06615 [Gemmatimonadetes bacterium]|nr:MAG: hypothetical protein D6675_06615 [Gemmatimonadota bacterium]